jgi:hypothetical protein
MSWTCPYCRHTQIVFTQNYSQSFRKLYIGKSKYGEVGIRVNAIRCLNDECKEITLDVAFSKVRDSLGDHDLEGVCIANYHLRPESLARPFPAYIPEILRQD